MNSDLIPVAWESLLNPRAQDALTALAQGASLINEDKLLLLLNGHIRPVAVIPDAEDAWIVGLLSPRARAGLIALEKVEDADAVLEVLNAGAIAQPHSQLGIADHVSAELGSFEGRTSPSAF
ncbi:hypothetical protein DFH09DRAFT_1303268 [Mycena vulgaris]|nr:hypothetical protein DFH09DRAFT_1303268 [Mycena vulgaris]